MRTHGKSRPGRLTRLDVSLSQIVADILAPTLGGPVVDFGIGASPWTTLEWFQRLHARWPHLRGIGVDNDPIRLATARKMAPETRFVSGDFHELPEPPRLLRAINVLRDYPPALRPGLRRELSRQLEDGGVLVEGRTDRPGDVTAVRLFRRRGQLVFDGGWLFAADPRRGTSPLVFLGLVACEPPGAALVTRWARLWENHRSAQSADAFATTVAALGGTLLDTCTAFLPPDAPGTDVPHFRLDPNAEGV